MRPPVISLLFSHARQKNRCGEGNLDLKLAAAAIKSVRQIIRI